MITKKGGPPLEYLPRGPRFSSYATVTAACAFVGAVQRYDAVVLVSSQSMHS